MAEGWLRHLVQQLPFPANIAVNSAGLEAHGLNPGAVQAMAAHGVNISSQHSKILDDNLIETADILISVCSHADSHCPILPDGKTKLHIPFDDPALARGTHAEIEAEFVRVCLQIKERVSLLLADLLEAHYSEIVNCDFQQQDVEIISRKASHEGFIPVDVLQLKHKLYNGGWSEALRRELALRNPAVGVLLYDPNREVVVLVKQFRTGALSTSQSPWLLEVVAGIADAGEAPADVVKRETKEEANCEIDELELICEYFNSPGWTNEKVSLFCARVDSTQMGGIHGLDDEHEDILIVIKRLDEVVAAIANGEINNAMTIIAVQWLQLNKSNLDKRWRNDR